jgi:hypothetical protein
MGAITHDTMRVQRVLTQAAPSLPVPMKALVPLPALTTQCEPGYGLAVCPTLGLLVTSDFHTRGLSVWTLPTDAGDGGASGGAGGGPGGGLSLVCTLGGTGSAAPMPFAFLDSKGCSGYLAFTPPTSDGSDAHPLLLVTDAGHDAVHLVDVVGRSRGW